MHCPFASLQFMFLSVDILVSEVGSPSSLLPISEAAMNVSNVFVWAPCALSTSLVMQDLDDKSSQSWTLLFGWGSDLWI